MLKEGERLDDLQINGLKIIQNARLYTFTSDSVLLANSVKAGPRTKAVDLCSGSGIVGILLAGKLNAGRVDLVEIQPSMCDMAERSVELNGLSDRVKVHNVSVQRAPEILGKAAYDTAVCNPPYKKEGSGPDERPEHIRLATTEIALTLKETVAAAAELLKYGGRFYLIHRADRLAEIAYELSAAGLEPKKMTLIVPKAGKEPDTVIFEAVKGGKVGLKTSVITVYDESGNYTERVKQMYGAKESK